MVEPPPDASQDLDEELEEYEDDLADIDTEIRELIASMREETDASIRLVIRYSGDSTDTLFVREDIRELYSDPELEERIEALTVKGLGDPPREEALYDFGRLDATIRWYDDVIVAHFPYREWSGLAFSFDRRESPIVDLAARFLDD